MKGAFIPGLRFVSAGCILSLIATAGCVGEVRGDDAAYVRPADASARTTSGVTRVRIAGDAAGDTLPLRGERRVASLRARGEIAAFAHEGELMIWTVENESDLRLARIDAPEPSVESIAALAHDVEALCIAPVGEDVYDVFAGDGDGRLHHYWLSLRDAAPRLHPVRSLFTNPEVERCRIEGERVYFLDPVIGVAAYERDAENDPVLYPVHFLSPAEAGDAEASDFRLARVDGELRVFLIRAGNETAYPIDPGAARDPAEVSAETRRDAGSPPQSHRTAPPARKEDTSPGVGETRKIQAVQPALETEPVDTAGDAADDPAVLAGSRGRAWIVGADKQRGLRAYDLQGRQIHFLPRGRLNNVDAVALEEDRFLIAASNRSAKSIDLFLADLAAGRLEFRAAVPLDLDDPYGLCMGVLPDERIAVFVGDTGGRVETWTIDPAGLSGRLWRTLEFDGQTEGCVYDPASRRLFVGEEARGIWSVEPGSGERRLFDAVGAGLLTADVEGLDIYQGAGGRRLVASSQGDDSFVVYFLGDSSNDALGDAAHDPPGGPKIGGPTTGGPPPTKFRIVADRHAGLDGASETDGLAVTAKPLPGFPRGLLVVQDGRNRAPDANQNFKVVDWRNVPGAGDE